MAAHCLRLHLGSLAEPRFNKHCEHGHPNSKDSPSLPPIEPTVSTTCCGTGCTKRPVAHCKHCVTSLCKDHLEAHLCTAEYLPQKHSESFICRSCAPKVDACKHNPAGCATCNEMHFFKLDLLKCANAANNEDILGRARSVCESIDTMIGHTARLVNQERYWPEMLDQMKGCPGKDGEGRKPEYDHVLLKSDYWKKFQGTVTSKP